MTGSRYAELLQTYTELLGIEERVLSALYHSHGPNSTQYRRQHNKAEKLRLQVAELEKLTQQETEKTA